MEKKHCAANRFTIYGLLATLLAVALMGPASVVAQPAAGEASDPFLWLEDVDGARAMDWVKNENGKTMGVLEADARYPALYQQALSIAQAHDRIPLPRFLHGDIYNYWQDEQHVRGIWRKTSFASYQSDVPEWNTVLDLDALSTQESANWVWKGADCLRPDERLCLVNLSDGGEDAVTLREFDLSSGQFVPGGFALPKSKQHTAWLNQDQLLVTRDWGPGTLTASGYPFVVKTLRRGQSLDAATEIFRGQPSDVAIEFADFTDGAGNKAVFVLRAVSYFEVETYLVTPTGAVRVALPLKAPLEDLVAGRLLVRLNQSWTVGKQSFPQGALVSIDLAALRADPQQLTPVLVYTAGARESLGEIASTHSHLLLTVYRNVKGRAYIYTPTEHGRWQHAPLPLPDNASIDVVNGDSRSEQAFVNVAGFLSPSSLWLIDSTNATGHKLKQLPAQFDATGLSVEQHFARSSDGTQIPYFLVHRAGMQPDGQNPTLMTAYGGFQISMTPFYSGTLGKLWLERGGVFVLANIRGGGEFGPAWHEAGLKTHRQRIYDDFAAVAEDLMARKVTSPRRLGIEGGSNGGLLMGVEFTQHPELWNAVDIQVPLLDMLRFESIAAGASWVGEYGSVSNPTERAFLASISPYNNLRSGVTYPEPLIWTTTKDDRVGPQHARKFAAKLAAMGVPYLYYEVIEGGHAAGANLKERARTSALEMTDLLRKLMD